MEYKLVVQGSANALSKDVSALLREGWQLHGGIQMIYDPSFNCILFAQVMLREAPRKEWPA